MTDSLAAGGHFYCGVAYERTLTAFIVEHYCGAMTTNTDHDTSGLELFKVVSAYLHAYQALFRDRGANVRKLAVEAYFPGKEVPASQDLAALLLLVLHMDQLHPEVVEGDGTTEWERSAAFDHDFRWATRLTYSLLVCLTGEPQFFDMKELLESARTVETSASRHSTVLAKGTRRKPVFFQRLSTAIKKAMSREL